jgi:short-subunit dehydrogenase
MPNLADHRALVTGASSGIGAAMARILASWGADLVLVARRRDRLESLARQLEQDHGVRARAAAVDLADPHAPRQLAEDTRARGERIDILVNNAGHGYYRPFSTSSWEENRDLFQVDVTALVELTHRFVADMRGRDRRGYVLNVSSLASFAPVPYFAAYAGAKAFVRTFSETLAFELRGTNVSVTCLAPGGTVTEFSDAAGQTIGRMAQAGMMSAERCARAGLRGMLRKKTLVVPGGLNRMMAVMMRLAPGAAVAQSSAWILGEPTDDDSAGGGDIEGSDAGDPDTGAAAK